jgi:PAS domain S-box-containing protein
VSDTSLSPALDTALTQQEWLQVTLASIGDGVITCDTHGLVTFLNPVAENLTGWSQQAAVSQPLGTVFRIINESTRLPVDNPALRALREGVIVGLANHTLLIDRAGAERPIDDSAAPIRNRQGEIAGCVLVFRDVSKRREIEQQQAAVERQLRENDRQQKFLVQLSDLLRTLSDPVELQAQACRLLGQHLEANRVAYFEIHQEEYIVDHDYANGVPSLAGRYSIAAFGYYLIGLLRSGMTVVETDATILPLRSQSERDSFALIQVRGHIDVPLVKKGRFVAGLAVHSVNARVWTPAEVALVQQTAERTWNAIERARTDAALADRELRYRLIASAANDAIWDWDLGTNQVIWNGGIELLFGHSLAEFQTDAAWWVEHIHPEDRERIIHDIHEHIDHHQDEWQAEYRFLRANGDYAVINDRGRVLRNKQGREIRMIGSMLDLTNQHIAAAKLRAAEERFNFVRQSSGVGFWYCDLPFDVFEWDINVKAHFHLLPDERVTIKLFYERIHPADREPTRLSIEQSIQQRTSYDTIYRTVNPTTGEMKWIRAIGRTTYATSGEPIRFDGVTIDVTQQQLAEANTRESEARYRTLFDSMDEGFCVIELIFDQNDKAMDYQFIEVNPAFEKHTGLSAAKGKRVRAMIPNHDQHWFDTYERVSLTGQPVRFTNSSSVLNRWFELYAFRVEDRAKGRVAVLFNNITDRHVAELERERLLGQLRDQDRRKDEFLAMLSHELRNPLAPISNAVQFLRLQDGADELQQQVHAIIERQVGQMKHLIDDLLEVSRITTGRVQLRLERLDLRGIVQRAIETTRPLVEKRMHQLSVLLPNEPIWLEADAARLEQVVVNLLTNAAKYTLELGQIWLNVEPQDDLVSIRVRDTGVGISPKLLPHVFELFTQAERSLARSEGGLGIGLALVKRLVELHGGQVAVTSQLGVGSEFLITFPQAKIVRQEPTSPGSLKVSALPAAKQLRLLVVDDNVDAARSLMLLLQRTGHLVSIAHEGTTALQIAAEESPDVVLLDIGLPGISGYEVAKQMRADARLRNVTLIAMTGYGQEADRRLSEAAGFNHHLVKPADFGNLQKILEQVNLPSL